MNIVVFGAGGRVGRKVVAKLLQGGHSPRVFVHCNNPFGPEVEAVIGDIHKATDVARAAEGMDAVILALSSWGTPTKDILAAATTNLIAAIESGGPRRIVSLTGAGVFDAADEPALLDKLNHFVISHAAKRVFEDGENHVKLLRASTLDWTVVRSPIMVEQGQLGKYTLVPSFPLPWATILRDDVATAMVQLTTSHDWEKAAPFIHRAP